jgi:hypothetical protein
LDSLDIEHIDALDHAVKQMMMRMVYAVVYVKPKSNTWGVTPPDDPMLQELHKSSSAVKHRMVRWCNTSSTGSCGPPEKPQKIARNQKCKSKFE